MGSGKIKKLRKALAAKLYASDDDRVREADARVARVEQALRESETQHDREMAEARRMLAEERRTRTLYMRVWLEREGGPLLISQNTLRAVAEEARKSGSRLVFEVQEDEETLKVYEISREEQAAARGAAKAVVEIAKEAGK